MRTSRSAAPSPDGKRSLFPSLEHDGYRLSIGPRLAGDRRCRQFRLAGLDHEMMFERVPRTFHVARGRGVALVQHIVADERTPHTELNVSLEVRVIARIDLRELGLIARLEDQEVNMRRTQVVAA